MRGAETEPALTLAEAVTPSAQQVLNPDRLRPFTALSSDQPVLVVLAAGKGTRFGQAPKCAQPVNGLPLARHSMDAFRRISPTPAICIVGYRGAEVAAALGDDNLYVHSANPTGGTAFAAYEAFGVAALEQFNPILIVTMGDRVVPDSVFRRLSEIHRAGTQEAGLTFLTAIYEPPRNRGKGRIVRDADRRVLGIIEQNDIDAIANARLRESLDGLTEGNCPLYAIRARTLRRHLERLSNDNAQRQFYLTDIIASLRRDGAEIRTLTITGREVEHALLCADVTRPEDLAALEALLRAATNVAHTPVPPELAQAAATIRSDRPAGQIASIAQQLADLAETASDQGFSAHAPVAVGIAGGRLRIAFMHPDMGRFYGPAWQMPLGAGEASGREQIVVLAQRADDGQIHLDPANPELREKIQSIPADLECMYPGAEVSDWYRYEAFGTRMAEQLLLACGYFSDEELDRRRQGRLPLPPPSLWTANNLRRPFPLVANALASLRTLRSGEWGATVQAVLGREHFRGLRLIPSGAIPRGGFASSSAVTVAVQNALNALYGLGLSAELLIHLACQAEYGTGVRAGSLDQTTEQSGRAGCGTLVSSNPRDNFRILATYPVPTARFQVLFPYSVDRDRDAWRWSAGTYAPAPNTDVPTTGELRKLTGKSAELAALLVRLPLDEDFFKHLEADFLRDGRLSGANRRWVAEVLRQLPLLIPQAELRERVEANRDWHVEQLAELQHLDPAQAAEQTDATLAALFAGWRNPVLRRAPPGQPIVSERGVPLRAMVAYLFAEVAKNFQLIHHPDDWIDWVSRSQRGDRCFEIDPERLPDAAALVAGLDWEKGLAGPALMERWLDHCGARPFDYNRGLEDSALTGDKPPEIHGIAGTNFFRGLALIDLAEAMLKRAFGKNAVAVRVNAAGQGDYFQVHVDSHQVQVADVKEFIRTAFYRRFGLSPEHEFVEPHPGGGAVGIRLDRCDQLSELARALAGG